MQNLKSQHKILSMLLAVMLAVGMMPLMSVSVLAASDKTSLVAWLKSTGTGDSYTIDTEITITAADSESTGTYKRIRMRENSKLTIAENGHLIIDNVALDVGDYAPTRYAEIKVESGGKLTVKGISADLNISGGSVIVEAGGEVFVEAGGVIAAEANANDFDYFLLDNSGDITINSDGRISGYTFSLRNQTNGSIIVNDEGELDLSCSTQVGSLPGEYDSANDGLIEMHDNGAMSLSASSVKGDDESRGTYYNNGTIRISGDAVSQSAPNNLDISYVKLLNKGTIEVGGGTNFPYPHETQDYLVAISHYAQLINEGTVTVANSGGIGVGISGARPDEDLTSTLLNQSGGTINVKNSGNSIGLYVDNYSWGDDSMGTNWIENHGTININNTDDEEGFGLLLRDAIKNTGTISNNGSVAYDKYGPSLTVDGNAITGGGKVYFGLDISTVYVGTDGYNDPVNGTLVTAGGVQKQFPQEENDDHFFLPPGNSAITAVKAGYQNFTATYAMPETLVAYNVLDEELNYEIVMTPGENGVTAITISQQPEAEIRVTGGAINKTLSVVAAASTGEPQEQTEEAAEG